MSVAVLIVNFRTPKLTIDAVRSALGEPEATEIIVVDNASGDDSVAILANEFASEPRVQLIASDRNDGFGAGNNLAARAASAPFLFLLNSDATFEPGCLAALLRHWATLSNVGILAPAIYRGSTGVLQDEASGPFPTAWRLLTQQSKRYGNSLAPDWVGGAGLLIQADVFAAVGGFDSEIFMYFEDVLLCWQVRQRGLGVHRTLDAGVRHLGGMSYGSESTQKANYFEAQDVFLEKIGEPRLVRLAVSAVRQPALHCRRLLRTTRRTIAAARSSKAS